MNVRTGRFETILFNINYKHKEILIKFSKGLLNKEIPKLKKKFGSCQLKVPSKSFWRLLVDEVFNPFYIF